MLEKIEKNTVKNVKYRRLLEQELKIFRQNRGQIINRAKKVYNMGNNPKHPRFRDCVRFKTLEEKALEYNKSKKYTKLKQNNIIT